MFSIIIPLYNKAPYIGKAIGSIAAQTCQDFELIVIDDGSTDDSLDKLRVLSSEFREKNIDFFNKLKIVEQHNQGVSRTRNTGVELARNEYIAFLDADDWWSSNYLEEMAKLIRNYPDAGIWGAKYYKVKNGQEIDAKIPFDKNFVDGYIDYLKIYSQTLWMPLWTGAVVVRKLVFNEIGGFNHSLTAGEDFEFFVRTCVRYPIAYLNKSLAFYNQDVDFNNRAVGNALHAKENHMIFFDFGELNSIFDFRMVFEKLALYSLKAYHVEELYKKEVRDILNSVNWKSHSINEYLFFNVYPICVLKLMKKTRFVLGGVWKKCKRFL
jgi:glycosyltransferase involved in cell wall biosynthesis